MAERAIETFDVRVERGVDDYVVVADSSYGGTYRGRFRDSIDRADIASLQRSMLRQHGRDVGGEGYDRADDDPDLTRRLGGQLFAALFAGELRSGLRDTMTLAQRDGHPLRIRLRLEATPELGPLPWELLRDDERDRFVAVSSQIQVVRHLGRPEPVRDVVLRGPLRVLVVVASPSDLPPLAVEREWELLAAELAPLVAAGRLELHRVDPPTFERLGRDLLDGPWHVFHFIGHGEQATSSLMFCDSSGRAQAISADVLAVALSDTVDLRLAVLNACHTARASDRDAFLGVAQELLDHSVPAVVAMQFAVSDVAAIAFAARFYAAISHGWAVDRAVGDARKALYQRGAEWATPVVHLRGDGVVFDVTAAEPPTAVPARRRRRPLAVVVAASLLMLAAIGGVVWALAARGDETTENGGLSTVSDDPSDAPTGCPIPGADWSQLELADDPSGEIAIANGTLRVTVRSLASRREDEGWLVVAGLELSNDTTEEISVGEWYVQELVVASRVYSSWCFDGRAALESSRTADLAVGFEVSCEPRGRVELVAGEQRDVPIVLTAEAEPAAC